MSFDAPPVPPGFVPIGSILNLAGRGEVFYRRHVHPDPTRPTLLLLHGWTASADLQWVTAFRALAATYSFIAIDHRGHGRGIRSNEPFSLEEAADDAAALVRALGIEKVVTVGYSMGGPISMLLWQRHRSLVSAMVLEATALEWHATRLDRLRWRLLAPGETFLRSRLSLRTVRIAMGRFARRNDELVVMLPWLTAEMRRTDPRSITQAGRALRHYDGRPFAGDIDVPTAMLITTKDRLVAPAKQRALAEAVRAEVLELAGDHDCCWTKGDEFATSTRALVDHVVARVAARAAVGETSWSQAASVASDVG